MLPLQINLLQQTKIHNGVVSMVGFPYIVWQQLCRICWNYGSRKQAELCMLLLEHRVFCLLYRKSVSKVVSCSQVAMFFDFHFSYIVEMKHEFFSFLIKHSFYGKWCMSKDNALLTLSAHRVSYLSKEPSANQRKKQKHFIFLPGQQTSVSKPDPE